MCVPWLCTPCHIELREETLVCSPIHLEDLAMLDRPLVRTDDPTLQRNSLENQTATSSSLTMESWTLSDLSPFWLGSTMREVLVLFLTTCRTAGVYTSGWRLPLRFLFVLRVDEDDASLLTFSTVALRGDGGNTLAQRTMKGPAWPNCIWTAE